MGQEAWAHWDYSPEEWARFDRIDWRMGRRVAIWLLISLPLALGAAVGFNGLVGLPGAVLTFALTMLVVWAGFWLYYRFLTETRGRHLARRKRGQSHQVTLSPQGIWLAGTYFPLNDFSSSLQSSLQRVTLTPEPPVLHFRRKLSTGTSSVTYGTVHVLVPRGHEDEAARLMQRYHLEVIEPKKRLSAPPDEPRSSASPSI